MISSRNLLAQILHVLSSRWGRNTLVLIVALSYSTYVYSFKFGITGRTKKGDTPGCICHGSDPAPGVTVSITGPDTLQPNETAQYEVSVSGGPAIAAGTNIAAFAGDINAISFTLQKSDGELTHTEPVTFKGSVVTFTFFYTAPDIEGTDTIYANGNSVDGNNTFGGDQWNYAPNKVVVVQYPPGVVVSRDTVKKGWNIISLPVIPSISVKDSVFPGAATSAFAFSGAYTTVDTLQSGMGYWLKFDSAKVIDILGTMVERDTIPLLEGWNLIGSISFPVSAFQTNPSGLISSSVFEYDGGYIASARITPGKGYWVKSNGTGVLILDSASTSSSWTQISPPAVDQLNAVIFTDRLGRRQSLYFSEPDHYTKAQLQQFELPPVPGQGAFDVRFASQRIMEIAEPNEKSTFPIEISSAEYPVTLEWNLKNSMSGSALILNNETLVLEKSGSIVLNEPPGRIGITLGGHPSTPDRFALFQNYPNPFNPTTDIRFEIGDRSFVSVKVFDILGHEVQTLLESELSPGMYNRTFDAAALSSGIYFLRMTAVSNQGVQQFSRQQKLVLLR